MRLCNEVFGTVDCVTDCEPFRSTVGEGLARSSETGFYNAIAFDADSV